VAANGDDAEHVEHDRYFRVTRVKHRPSFAFVRGLLQTHSWAHENGLAMGVSILDPVEWQEMFAGLDALLRYAAGDRLKEGVPVVLRSAPRHTPAGYDPERRWLIGHQLFFALLQGVIVGLNCYLGSSATDGGDPDSEAAADADGAVRVAAAFMRSSAAAIKFTADFGPVDYDARIRPAMSPPSVREGFSGLQTRDHAYLVGLFARLRTTAAAHGQGPAGEAFEQFVEATVTAYEAHKFICARFGGDVLPSLRMAAASRGRSTQAGVTALRQLMRARLFALTPESSPARAAVPTSVLGSMGATGCVTTERSEAR
jgi:plasmid stability protein